MAKGHRERVSQPNAPGPDDALSKSQSQLANQSIELTPSQVFLRSKVCDSSIICHKFEGLVKVNSPRLKRVNYGQGLAFCGMVILLRRIQPP